MAGTSIGWRRLRTSNMARGDDIRTLRKEQTMPHVIVKLWPGKSEQQKQKLADKITQAIGEMLHYREESVSVGFEEIAAKDWTERSTSPTSLTTKAHSTKSRDTGRFDGCDCIRATNSRSSVRPSLPAARVFLICQHADTQDRIGRNIPGAAGFTRKAAPDSVWPSWQWQILMAPGFTSVS